MNRREFVKGCAVAAGAGALAAAGFGIAKPLSNEGQVVGKVRRYVGAKRIAGPAPRGVGIIPVEVDAEGRLVGATGLAGGSVLPWFRYCGHQHAPGLHEAYSGDNHLRYFVTPDKIAQGFNPWYKDLVGKVMNVKDFPEPGFGAAFNWRSEGASGADIVTGIAIRVGKDPARLEGLGRPLTFEKVDQRYVDAITAQVEETGFLAFSSYCTHFCCVPGWKEDERAAKPKGYWDEMYCTCHGSAYDPATLAGYQFIEEIPVDPATGLPEWE